MNFPPARVRLGYAPPKTSQPWCPYCNPWASAAGGWLYLEPGSGQNRLWICTSCEMLVNYGGPWYAFARDE